MRRKMLYRFFCLPKLLAPSSVRGPFNPRGDPMRKYETFFIADPDLPDETNSAVDNKVQSIVTSNGGEVLTYVPWGKRKLAYAIRKRTRGLYVLMEYAGGPSLWPNWNEICGSMNVSSSSSRLCLKSVSTLKRKGSA